MLSNSRQPSWSVRSERLSDVQEMCFFLNGTLYINNVWCLPRCVVKYSWRQINVWWTRITFNISIRSFSSPAYLSVCLALELDVYLRQRQTYTNSWWGAACSVQLGYSTQALVVWSSQSVVMVMHIQHNVVRMSVTRFKSYTDAVGKREEDGKSATCLLQFSSTRHVLYSSLPNTGIRTFEVIHFFFIYTLWLAQLLNVGVH